MTRLIQVLLFGGLVLGMTPSLFSASKLESVGPATSKFVNGRNFQIPQTQQIKFVPLEKFDPRTVEKEHLPSEINLRSHQSAIKSQGQRDACTYFVIIALAESLIKQATGEELDLSEEYLAWSAKAKTKMRTMEEESSVAVNALALQSFGVLLEKDLPYQPGWFHPGQPCAHEKKGAEGVDPICYAHNGPTPEQERRILGGHPFVFEAISSSSLDIIRSLAHRRAPVSISILGHHEMWDQTAASGNLYLSEKWKSECQAKPKLCSGHAALIVGYDLKSQVFHFKNSWGEPWGNAGYGTIPFNYIDQMSKRKLLTGKLQGHFPLVQSAK